MAATLVETPLDVKPKVNGRRDSEVLQGVIHLKEAKFNEHGTLRFQDAVAEKETLESIETVKFDAFPENIVKHDIVKKSTSRTEPSHPKSESDGKTEGSSTRPVTVASDRDVWNETKRDHQSPPLSIKIDKKPLQHINRSVSEYGRSPSISRQPVLGPGQSRFDHLPLGITYDHRGYPTVQGKFSRAPTKLIRLATVTMSARTKPTPRAPMASLYYEEPKKPKKVIGWDEANNARPPLRIDMEGPGPCTYSPVNKPLGETNAPSWSFGTKTQPDKEGGSRRSWEKSWFQTPHLYQQKTDFFSDTSWPTPSTYKSNSLLGPKQRTFTEAPSFTIGKRKNFEMAKPGADKQPSPQDYERDSADKMVFNKGPSFSHQFRREGTVLWPYSEKTPGPAAYSPSYVISKNNHPAFTIRNLRREKSHVLGPFSTL